MTRVTITDSDKPLRGSVSTSTSSTSTDPLQRLQTILQITFRNIELLRRALTHPTYLESDQWKCTDEKPDPTLTASSSHLAFVGDAVLNLAIRHLLRIAYPEADVGTLSGYKTRLVKADQLQSTALHMKLAQFLFLGPKMRGEMFWPKGERIYRTRVASELFEALVGAVYEDQGFTVALTLVARLFRGKIEALRGLKYCGDPKTDLRNLLEKNGLGEVHYRCSGRDDRNRLIINAFIGDIEVGTGTSGNLRTAQIEAAVSGLYRLRRGIVVIPGAENLKDTEPEPEDAPTES